MTERRVRIGIDTGGTFTDVVAVDEETGQTTTTKTPSTPADPAEGFLNGVRKVLGMMHLDGSAVTAVSHGTTVATNQLLEGKLDRIGFITTEGYESVLEIARQSVPDGYGNSYFWVKPPRIEPAAHRAHQVGRHDPRRLDPEVAVAVAVGNRLPRDLQHRLVALGGDEPDPVELALEQLVGGHGGAVADGGHRLAGQIELGEHLADAGQEALRRVGRGGRCLGGAGRAGLLVHRDDVGEGAAGVDADAHPAYRVHGRLP